MPAVVMLSVLAAAAVAAEVPAVAADEDAVAALTAATVDEAVPAALTAAAVDEAAPVAVAVVPAAAGAVMVMPAAAAQRDLAGVSSPLLSLCRATSRHLLRMSSTGPRCSRKQRGCTTDSRACEKRRRGCTRCIESPQYSPRGTAPGSRQS